MMLSRHMNQDRDYRETYGLTKHQAIPINEWLAMPPREPVRKALVTSGTRNVYKYMVASVKSYLCNSDVDRVFMLVEDDVFPYEIPECVTCIDVRKQKWFPAGNPNSNCKFTYMAVIRSALCYIFPEYDRILCVDMDTIAVSDVSELFELPLDDDCYFSAAHEPALSRKTRKYYTNAGVCIHNLKKLRDGKADEIIQRLNLETLFFGEQDAMNNHCQGHIQPLDSIWNGCDYVDPPTGPIRIEHYAGPKNWETRTNMHLYRDMPWDEVIRRHDEHLRNRI